MKNQFIRRLFPPKEIATDYWLQTVHSNARITSIVVSFCVAVQSFLFSQKVNWVHSTTGFTLVFTAVCCSCVFSILFRVTCMPTI